MNVLGINKLKGLLQPAPYIDEIEDEETVAKNYKYWRMRVFYSMFVGYALFYFTRKSFTFAMPVLIADLGFDKGQLGLLATILSLAYGLSKFVSGIIADRSNPRYFMAIALMLTGVMNLFFGLSSSLWLFAIFWGLNGWFQGGGWPPCARYLTHWYSQNERGRWWAFWNTSHNVGGFLIPILAAFFAAKFGWRYAMYIPGVICIFGGLFLINRLRDTPQSLGLPAIEKFRNDYSGNVKKNEVEKELSAKEILFKYVLNNPWVWMLGIANFFVYIVRLAINDWSALFLVEGKGYSIMAAGMIVCWFEVGGLFGSLAAGWLSDKVFKGKRGPVNVIFALVMVASVVMFRVVPAGHVWLDGLAVFMTGFWIFGPQMLIGVAAAELAHKKAAATASGFTGLFGYAGAAIAGWPLGVICETWGWTGFFTTITVCGIVSFFLLIPLWSVSPGRGKVKPKVDADAEPSLA